MSVSFCHRPLGEIVADVASWNPVRDGQDRLIRYIDLSSVNQDTKVIDPNEPIVAREAPSRARQLVQTGDVLVSTVRPNLNGVSRVPETLDGSTASTGFCVLRPKDRELDGGYLFHWVKAPMFIADMVRKATGASYPAVSDRIVMESLIPLPPLAEQWRIAAILDQAEALRAKRRHALAYLDTLNQSLFLDRFGDPVANPKNWPLIGLLEFFDFRTGKLDSNAAVEGGVYPFFTCSRDDFRIDRYAFDCEALLLAGNNANADYSVKHFKGKFNAYQRTYVLTLKNEANTFAYAKVALERKLTELKRISKGTNTKYLTLGILKTLCIQLPPISLQREFSVQVSVVERLKATQRVSLAKLDALFTALQHRAFRGEL